MKEFKDYFGNPIEVGDIVLRNCNSHTYMTKVVNVTKSAVYLERTGNQRFTTKWDRTLGQYTKREYTRPLYVQYFTGINLSKLDNQLIQQTIKSYLNDI